MTRMQITEGAGLDLAAYFPHQAAHGRRRLGHSHSVRPLKAPLICSYQHAKGGLRGAGRPGRGWGLRYWLGRWGGWGSNPRPADYESAALTG